MDLSTMKEHPTASKALGLALALTTGLGLISSPAAIANQTAAELQKTLTSQQKTAKIGPPQQRLCNIGSPLDVLLGDCRNKINENLLNVRETAQAIQDNKKKENSKKK